MKKPLSTAINRLTLSLVLLFSAGLVSLSGCRPVTPIFLDLPQELSRSRDGGAEVLIGSFAYQASDEGLLGELLTYGGSQQIRAPRGSVSVTLANNVARAIEAQGLTWGWKPSWDGTAGGMRILPPQTRAALYGNIRRLSVTKQQKFGYAEYNLTMEIEAFVGLTDKGTILTRSILVEQQKSAVDKKNLQQLLAEGFAEAGRKITADLRSLL
ncbi:MAG: hypothetical protein AB1568_05285 [Thermodesulfobacteriota bacterium]